MNKQLQAEQIPQAPNYLARRLKVGFAAGILVLGFIKVSDRIIDLADGPDCSGTQTAFIGDGASTIEQLIIDNVEITDANLGDVKAVVEGMNPAIHNTDKVSLGQQINLPLECV